MVRTRRFHCQGRGSIPGWGMIPQALWHRQKEKEKGTCQNLSNAAIAVLRGEFVALSAYIRKEKRSQINTLKLKKE